MGHDVFKFSEKQPFSINLSYKYPSRACHDSYHHAIIPSNIRTHRWPLWALLHIFLDSNNEQKVTEVELLGSLGISNFYFQASHSKTIEYRANGT